MIKKFLLSILNALGGITILAIFVGIVSLNFLPFFISPKLWSEFKLYFITYLEFNGILLLFLFIFILYSRLKNKN